MAKNPLYNWHRISESSRLRHQGCIPWVLLKLGKPDIYIYTIPIWSQQPTSLQDKAWGSERLLANTRSCPRLAKAGGALMTKLGWICVIVFWYFFELLLKEVLEITSNSASVWSTSWVETRSPANFHDGRSFPIFLAYSRDPNEVDEAFQHCPTVLAEVKTRNLQVALEFLPILICELLI